MFPRIRQLDLLYFLSIYLYLRLISLGRISCHLRPARAELPSLVVVIERQHFVIMNSKEAVWRPSTPPINCRAAVSIPSKGSIGT